MTFPRSLSGFYDLRRLSQKMALVVSVSLSLEYSKQIPEFHLRPSKRELL